MSKRIFLIHRWEGCPDGDWLPWLKKELEQKGFNVIVPAMPDAKNPKMSVWVEHLAKVVGKPDEQCYFVGHSLGCITILRYIESLEMHQKIGGVVLVAGFTSNLGYEELESFFKKHIDWNKITALCRKFVAIYSDNDPYVSLHYGDFFKEKLGAKVILEHNMKHFSDGDGVVKLPIALESILKIVE